MKRHERLIEQLMEANPEALLLEPRNDLDPALVRVVHRPCAPPVAGYDVGLLIECFKKANGWTDEQAWEWYDYNVACAYLGEHTPVYLDAIKDTMCPECGYDDPARQDNQGVLTCPNCEHES